MTENNLEKSLWTRKIESDPEHSLRFAQRFREMRAAGKDINGEARFVDAMAPRNARILDAGCGSGRVGGPLAARGHAVVGVDVDPTLIAIAREDYPGVTWLVGDLAEISFGSLASAAEGPDATAAVSGRGSDGLTDRTAADADRAAADPRRTDPAHAPHAGSTRDGIADKAVSVTEPFDVIVAAGNVLPFLAPSTRQRTLENLRTLLAAGGRMTLGFGAGRGYAFADFFDDCAATGWAVTATFRGWNLLPFDDESDFLVAVMEPTMPGRGAGRGAGRDAGRSVAGMPHGRSAPAAPGRLAFDAPGHFGEPDVDLRLSGSGRSRFSTGSGHFGATGASARSTDEPGSDPMGGNSLPPL